MGFLSIFMPSFVDKAGNHGEISKKYSIEKDRFYPDPLMRTRAKYPLVLSKSERNVKADP